MRFSNLFVVKESLVVGSRIAVCLCLRVHPRLLLAQLHQLGVLFLDLRLERRLLAHASVSRRTHAIDDRFHVRHLNASVADFLRQLLDFRAKALQLDRERLVVALEFQKAVLFFLPFLLHLLQLLRLPFQLTLLFEFPKKIPEMNFPARRKCLQNQLTSWLAPFSRARAFSALPALPRAPSDVAIRALVLVAS